MSALLAGEAASRLGVSTVPLEPQTQSRVSCPQLIVSQGARTERGMVW
jgi:hypothetical protein